MQLGKSLLKDQFGSGKKDKKEAEGDNSSDGEKAKTDYGTSDAMKDAQKFYKTRGERRI